MKIGLIGAGRIAQLFHIKILANMPGINLAAVADTDPLRLDESLQLAPNAVGFADYADLLGQTDIESVVITLPTGMHATVAKAAFAVGKHVYLEKPIATNLDEAADLLNTWQDSGKIGMIGYDNRFHPIYQTVKKQLDADRIGNLVGVRAVLCSPARSLPDWKIRRESGGGVLLDLASHLTDLVCFLLDQEVVEVSANIRSIKSEADNATLELRLANDLQVQLFVSLTAIQENRFEFYGNHGKLAVDRFGDQLVYSPPRRSYRRMDRLVEGLHLLKQTPRELWKRLMPPSQPSIALALRSFVTAVQNHLPPEIDLMAGYRSLAVIVAAEESARLGRSVGTGFGANPMKSTGLSKNSTT